MVYDYRIFGDSAWVFLDNFANLLWDADWWQALWTSATTPSSSSP